MNGILLAVIVLASSLSAQEAPLAAPEQTFRVALKTVAGFEQSMGLGLEIKFDASGRGAAAIPGGLVAEIQRTPAPLEGIVIRIPNAEPASLVLLRGQDSVVTLKRTVGELQSAPYMVGYSWSERKGETHEALFWRPFYRAQGKLKLPGCELGLMVLDFNGDGVFDAKDSRQATTIGLDVNNDGLFFGAAEYRKAEEIIDVCGLPLQVTELDPAGLYITFRTSKLTVPTLNAPLPLFSVMTSGGDLIRSSELRGKVHILDFWASWCAPCVAKLVAMEAIAHEHPNEVRVIGINVDEPERRAAAETLIREKALSFPQVIRAQGERDFLWKMFGSMQDVRLSVPLYVVIDSQGLVRYGAAGGDDLGEIKLLLQQMLKATQK